MNHPVDHRPLPFTAALGVLGWEHLDPLLLAALSLEAPVLLVGEHGTAKTLLVERLAAALSTPFRHYNASLLNYDDLVGIPLPDDTGNDLRFVGTAGAVWGAEFVFFDEINRCRADLQNKMFPLVHERRIAGVDLPELRHRWGAMNPPSGLDHIGAGGYLGTEPLDLALADRFWFVVRVPSWTNLSRDQRERLVAGDVPTVAVHDIDDLVARTTSATADVERDHGPLMVRYTVILLDLLRSSGIQLSPRRARMIARSISATAAAARVLGRSARPGSTAHDELSALAELVVLNGLPQWCEPTLPSTAQVLAAHTQAWDVALAETDSLQRALLEEADLVERLRVGLQSDAPDEVLGTLAIGAVTSLPTEAERMALGLVLSRALADQPLTPAAWSVIGSRAARATRPGKRLEQVAPGPRLNAWCQASARLARLDAADALDALEDALLNACGAELLAEVRVDDLARQLCRWCALFGVTE